MKQLKARRIEQNIDEFMNERTQEARNASFDYCFNYFQEMKDQGHSGGLSSKSNLEQSCLHLGFYLASWGMYRGSTKLHRTSLAALKPTIDLISNQGSKLWDLDLPQYNSTSISDLLDFDQQLEKVIPGGKSVILRTKVMLGVFGCVPALDRKFSKGSGVKKLNKSSLGDFLTTYQGAKATYDDRQLASYTLDLSTGAETARRYPVAKLMDMAYFIEGS